MFQRSTVFFAVMLFCSSLLRAQAVVSPQDTLPGFSIQTVVVTADRESNPVSNSTSSVTTLSSRDIGFLPVTKFSDAAKYIPGFFIVDQDGLGRNPVVSTRGFYGGGEAEYILVLVDGKPINDLETGLVNWNLIPMNAVSSVEIARGAASPMYGDIALGGVMNIFTRYAGGANATLSLDGGSYGALDAGFHYGASASIPVNLYGSTERTDGWRDHSTWRGTMTGGSVDLPVSHESLLRVSASYEATKLDDPGPLTLHELDADPRQSSPYYKADNRDEKHFQLATEYRYSMVPDGTELSMTGYVNQKQSDNVRTFLTPAEIVLLGGNGPPQPIGLYDTTMYGDTKERDLKSTEAGGNLKFSLANGSPTRFLAGIDGSYGKLTSTYYAMFSGFEDDYRAAAISTHDVVADGDATRWKLAFYTGVEEHFSDPLTLSIGGRFDMLRDSYDGRTPASASLAASHNAVSVKYGANYRYVQHEGTNGNLYVNFNRSFKAPTLDQLTDQRPITAGMFSPVGTGGYVFFPAPFPPFSNPGLVPQTASSYEIGFYQSIILPGGVSTEHTLSLYQTDMQNEIDFDLTTYHYRNVQQSRHLGLESGSRLNFGRDLTAFANYTWTSVRFTAGPNDGNFFKAIPRHVVTIGASCNAGFGLRAELDWNFTRTTFLDDENTALLPDFNFGSAKLAWRTARYEIFAEIRNLLDNQYSSTGYFLYGTTYMLPAAGRTLHAGLSAEL